jgi:hypothetical protein
LFPGGVRDWLQMQSNNPEQDGVAIEIDDADDLGELGHTNWQWNT